FITTVAALLAEHIAPSSKNWFLYSHNSAEPGHRAILNTMQATPILDMGMRLGEASGAASLVPLLRLSCALHSKMATFSEAEVSKQSS
ncbi:MAG: nicotinate-nucleotide--dimethylbenzimidazole phosphoribosyltransferase, partial [Gammaproteobacteria bacterium]|nr:nicotinate-nucleotide--dimethylbenzimidazole phosphoribosyltransferase [Gammaproteobacteria bacterium]